MSERTTPDRELLCEGLRLVEEWRKTHEDRARMARVEANAEMERRQAGAYAAVAAVVRRELEAPGAGEDVRERLARECVEEAERLRYWYGEWYVTAQRLLREAAALLRTPAAPADGSARGALWDEVYEIVLDAMDEAHGPDGTLENAEMYADRILALLCPTRGEVEEVWPGDAENDASFLRSWARYLRTEAQDIREAQDLPDWKRQAEYTERAAARMDQIANRIAALRSDAQGDGPVR